MFQNKNILLIGGTGTVAKALLSIILSERNKTNTITIFSRDERKQFSMEFEEFYGLDNIQYVIGDIRDKDQIKIAMKNCDMVYHLAALKHVKSCEYNPCEAIKTNIIGTKNVIDCSIYHNIERLIYTSTDKAANPSNVMGITKLLGERLVSSAQNYCNKHDIGTIMSSLRFGNIIGSRGSVIPLWIDQIKKDRFITLTDPSMSRYLITNIEATRLILKSSEIAKGGEVFLFKMASINMMELANAVIGKYSCGNNIGINIIGIRDGEKIYEEIMTDEEKTRAYEVEDMYVIMPQQKELRDFLSGYYLSIGARKIETNDLNSHNAYQLTREEIGKLLESERSIAKGYDL